MNVLRRVVNQSSSQVVGFRPWQVKLTLGGWETSSHMQQKDRIVRVLRIVMPIVAIISAVVFVPWDIVPWLTPLPDTAQAQVDDAIDHGLDGTIVYVDQSGKAPAFYSIARYHEDIDTVVVQFVNATGGDTWGVANIIGGKATAISNIIYNRIVRILHRQ